MKLIFSQALFLILACSSSAQNNVGVGTTTPSEKLEVMGNIKLDTIKPAAIKLTANSGMGKILMSDATGNANWSSSAIPSGNVGYGVWGDCATNGNISEYTPVAPDDGAPADWFGYSVAISGTHALVGARLDDIGAFINQGSVSFFQHDGNNWILSQKMTDASATVFGTSVAIDGNFAVVSMGSSVGIGAANVYLFNGATWVLTQKITDASGVSGDGFGTAVSISGNRIIIGANKDGVGANTEQGSVSIYQYNGTSWVLMQKITDATGTATAEFGSSVAISDNYAIVGARWENLGANTDQGSASIYKYNGTNWVLMNKIVDATGTTGDQFGISVSIAGNYAIIGASSDDVGTNLGQGSASIYNFGGISWQLTQKITDPLGLSGDAFGVSVFISGKYALIGAVFHDEGSNINQGTANVYTRIGNGWQKLQTITDPAGAANDNLGKGVAIDAASKRFLIGAYIAFPGGKAIFGKLN